MLLIMLINIVCGCFVLSRNYARITIDKEKKKVSQVFQNFLRKKKIENEARNIYFAGYSDQPCSAALQRDIYFFLVPIAMVMSLLHTHTHTG